MKTEQRKTTKKPKKQRNKTKQKPQQNNSNKNLVRRKMQSKKLKGNLLEEYLLDSQNPETWQPSRGEALVQDILAGVVKQKLYKNPQTRNKGVRDADRLP